VVDADEHCDASHDAGPLPLELVRLSQMTVEAGIQQAHNSCEREHTDPKLDKISRNYVKRQQANLVMELLRGIIFELMNMHFYKSYSDTCTVHTLKKTE